MEISNVKSTDETDEANEAVELGSPALVIETTMNPLRPHFQLTFTPCGEDIFSLRSSAASTQSAV
eukprot:759702-Hanusia_phi.AAC.1